MRRSRSLALAAGLAIVAALAAAAPVAAQAEPPTQPPPSRPRVAVPEDDPEFVALLSRLAERAALYRQYALGFTCREVVIEAKYELDSESYRKGDRSTYDYLFEETPAGLREFREELIPDKDGYKRRSTDFEPDAPPAYTWATLFSKENRGRFHFRPAGQVVKAYRLLTLLDFIGTAPNPGGNNIAGWSGRVAIDQRSLNLWSVEAQPSGQDVRLEVEILRYRRAFAIAGVPLAARPHGVSLALTFGIEVEGLSYPTEQILSRTSLAPSQKMTLSDKTTFRYEDYRFFEVTPKETVKEGQVPEVEAPRP